MLNTLLFGIYEYKLLTIYHGITLDYTNVLMIQLKINFYILRYTVKKIIIIKQF